MLGRVILGVVIGSLIGGLVGYWGKCSGGTCPLTCNPIGGILAGAFFGLFIATSFQGRPGPETPASPHFIAVTSADHLKGLLAEKDVVLVDFSATWCGPCRILRPTIDKLADAYAGRVVVAGVDVDAQAALAEEHGVRAVPDVRLFKKGVQVAAFTGVRSSDEYQAALDKLLVPSAKQ